MLKKDDLYKRKYGDQQIVRVGEILAEEGLVLLIDTNGAHFVAINKIPTYFVKVETNENNENKIIGFQGSILDDAKHHNIAMGMNSPSTMQKYAYLKETE